MKFVGHVSRLCEQIIWVVTCQDHVISRFCNYDITEYLDFIDVFSKKKVLVLTKQTEFN